MCFFFIAVGCKSLSITLVESQISGECQLSEADLDLFLDVIEAGVKQDGSTSLSLFRKKSISCCRYSILYPRPVISYKKKSTDGHELSSHVCIIYVRNWYISKYNMMHRFRIVYIYCTDTF